MTHATEEVSEFIGTFINVKNSLTGAITPFHVEDIDEDKALVRPMTVQTVTSGSRTTIVYKVNETADLRLMTLSKQGTWFFEDDKHSVGKISKQPGVEAYKIS